jgi:hypothetical protein
MPLENLICQRRYHAQLSEFLRNLTLDDRYMLKMRVYLNTDEQYGYLSYLATALCATISFTEASAKAIVSSDAP